MIDRKRENWRRGRDQSLLGRQLPMNIDQPVLTPLLLTNGGHLDRYAVARPKIYGYAYVYILYIPKIGLDNLFTAAL